MILYLTAKTSIPDLYIDYIEVRLASGQEVSLNWDESSITRSASGFSARYKGVCFGEEYANGKLEQLCDMEIVDIGVYYETEHEADISIEIMEFAEDGKRKIFNPPKLVRKGCVTVD